MTSKEIEKEICDEKIKDDKEDFVTVDGIPYPVKEPWWMKEMFARMDRICSAEKHSEICSSETESNIPVFEQEPPPPSYEPMASLSAASDELAPVQIVTPFLSQLKFCATPFVPLNFVESQNPAVPKASKQKAFQCPNCNKFPVQVSSSQNCYGVAKQIELGLIPRPHRDLFLSLMLLIRRWRLAGTRLRSLSRRARKTRFCVQKNSCLISEYGELQKKRKFEGENDK
jgi:hypothetical protein